MPGTLIIKTGAAGDVVRTSILLRLLKNEVLWVTDEHYKKILPDGFPLLKEILTVEEARTRLIEREFDLVLSLEEDEACAQLASSINSADLRGIYFNNGKIKYTPHSSGWFDMSLVSQFSKSRADELKKKNASSYQDLLCKMIDRDYKGEPYCIYENNLVQPTPGLIGLEVRAGTIWPNKAWCCYLELKEKLEKAGFEVTIFRQEKDIRDYMDNIKRCSCIISGDTLAMHVGLAYKKQVIALFTCTSPAEIYDYNLLTRIVSPSLNDHFYDRYFSESAINSITVDEVFKKVISLNIK